MLVVERDRVGAAAFSRLIRDRMVHEALGTRALPADVASTRGIRAHLVAPFVPAHTWLTGLAALWVEGHGGPPPCVDLAGKRGLHLSTTEVGLVPLVLHTGPLAGLRAPRGGLAIATTARACVDALAHSPASRALPTTASALRCGAVTPADLLAALADVSRNTTYKTRVAALIGALGSL